MRIIRYRATDGEQYGVAEDEQVFALDGGLTDPRCGDLVGPLADAQLLAPCEPRTIVCAMANYAGQLTEKGMDTPKQPGFFLKAPNTLGGPGDDIGYPEGLERLEYEGELAVVIGRTARNVPAEDFADYVLGYTCANDVTADDYRADGQWTRAKSADTFCPLGPWVETDIADPASLQLTTRVNGEVVQDSGTSDMVYGVPELLAWITRWITLQPGDVLLTGSPANVGPMSVGDKVEVSIDKIGTLHNQVVPFASL